MDQILLSNKYYPHNIIGCETRRFVSFVISSFLFIIIYCFIVRLSSMYKNIKFNLYFKWISVLQDINKANYLILGVHYKICFVFYSRYLSKGLLYSCYSTSSCQVIYQFRWKLKYCPLNFYFINIYVYIVILLYFIFVLVRCVSYKHDSI